MLYTIIQILAFQALFLLTYDLFLRKETFFNINRAYLLLTSLLSLILPFIKLPELQKVTTKDIVIQLPEVFIYQEAPTDYEMLVADKAGIILEQAQTPIWQIVLLIGIAIATLVFVIKLIKLYQLKHKNPKRWNENVLVVNLLRSNAAFSFFNTIFLGEKIPDTEKDTIYSHELTHVKELHSMDLLFFELIRIIFWFNPLVYIYQLRMKELHEFIADARAVKHNGRKEYYQSLLHQMFDVNNISFTNTFFKTSLIKKRIAMLQKSKSKQINLIKYVFLIPLVFTMLIYTSTEVRAQEQKQNIDLKQYSYQLAMSDSLTGETKEIHKKFEAFLKSNKDYVGWGILDRDTRVVSYYVHSKYDLIPEGYEEATVSFPNGDSYHIYMNFSYFDEAAKEEEDEVDVAQEIDVRVYDNEVEVPFAVIEEVPTTKDCNDLETNDERKKCMSLFIQKHVNKNFNTAIADSLKLSGRQRIFVSFKIDKEGLVRDAKARASEQALEDEAIRIINKLPQFIPGRQKGNLVTVPYSLPIVFQVAGDYENEAMKLYKTLISQRDRLLQNSSKDNPMVVNLNKQIDSVKTSMNTPKYDSFFEQLKQRQEKGMDSISANPIKNEMVPFSKVEKVPTHIDCQSLSLEKDRKKCTVDKVLKLVNSNFNKDLAATLNLPDNKQQIFAGFIIDKQGLVNNIKVRSPHEKLDEETKRVLRLIPQMIPGEHKGEKVNVAYFLPIVFQVVGKKNKN